MTDLHQGAMYPIRTVSELTGVNSITLRAWESRYGLIEPLRKESGHRLYAQDQIDLINRVVGLLDRGMRIGQVKAFLDNQQAVDESGHGGEMPVDSWRTSVDGMLAAVIRFDETGLDTVYNEALSRFDIRTTTRKLLTPLLRDLGERWATGLGTVAEEHFFGFYLRNKLGARFHHRVMNTGGTKLLMCCVPGDRHEIGLLFFALAVNEAGYHPVVLGSDMPLQELPATVLKTGCEAIIFSGMLEPSKELMKTQLPQLMSDVNVPVFMGGNASIGSMDELKRIGIQAIGADIEFGLKQLNEVLTGK